MADNKFPRGGFATMHFISALTSSVINYKISEQNRTHQEKLAEKNQQFAVSQEVNRQNFTIAVNKQQQEWQRQLSMENYQLRLQEQELNFQRQLKSTQYATFMKNWPLINIPEVIRREQVLPDDTVALRVVFSKCNDPIFSKSVFPEIEEGLKEYTELYNNEFQARNIQFYHNAFVSSISGGAVITNIHYALQELPVLVIDANVLPSEICVSCTAWGLGGNQKTSFTAFHMPYAPKIDKTTGKIVHLKSYYDTLTTQLLARLKLLVSYAFDSYNLFQYNRPPLLPRIAAYEVEHNIRGAILNDVDVIQAVNGFYSDIYEKILGTGEQSFAQLPQSYSSTILHKLRLDYAENAKDILTQEQFGQYLTESLDAWTYLRTDLSSDAFLQELLDGKADIMRYFSASDKEYFQKLSALMEHTGLAAAPLAGQVWDMIREVEFPVTAEDAALATVAPEAPETIDIYSL